MQRLLRLIKAQQQNKSDSRSPIQKLCDDFDSTHNPSASQRAEIKKYLWVHKQRDAGKHSPAHTSFLKRLSRLLT